ncbi:MAG: asparaginase [Planctomycetota bacterium]
MSPSTEVSGSPGGVRDGAVYPEQPALATVWRGDAVESVHRGAWCLVDTSGRVLEERGDVGHPFFTRSSVKCFQVLPLIESGAAERYGVEDAELAVAVSSHNAEPCHVVTARALLGRAGLDDDALGCGAQPPSDRAARLALLERGADPGRIHNNCSGKHAGFLATTQHLGADVGRYLDHDAPVQVMARDAVAEMTGVAPEDLGRAIDGCSAPTFRMPLTALAQGFARYTNPDGLEPERRAAAERVVDAVRRHPVLLAGTERRLCTAISRVTKGAAFPKIGAEAIYAIGFPGRDLGLAVKVDDGGLRGLHAVVVALLRRFSLIDDAAARALEPFAQRVVRNWDGIDVGRIEVL